jgi:NAD(P)-dependent dehydrogenase (short-subunit alcohol dehydrogenase family)
MSDPILIYGATGGIGSALARRLFCSGKRVHLVARNEERLKALAQEVGADYTLGDVTDVALFPRVMEDAGTAVDGLVYAVGTIQIARIQRNEPDDFLRDFMVNALGAALAVKAAIPALKKSGTNPAVTLFSSVAAVQGFPSHSSIGMAKGAVSGLTLSLAAELAPRIRVNAIAPSLVKTPLSDALLANEKTGNALSALHPLKRLGEADDIASLAAFLLSSESSWITGQILSVDGGRSTLAGTG